MIQQVVVILVVGACLAWAGWQLWRFVSPRKGGGCAGGCGCGKENAKDETRNAKQGERVMMVRSDDLRARVKARGRG
jgi:hypothetical protein